MFSRTHAGPVNAHARKADRRSTAIRRQFRSLSAKMPQAALIVQKTGFRFSSTHL